jgi:hypothetical protein
MIEHPTYNGTDRIPADRLSHKVIRFLEFLFADAITDVELVARELGVRGEMRERLRHALDRLACVQKVLEAIGEVLGGCTQHERRFR